MDLNKNSKFYITARKRLAEYIEQGYSVDDLRKEDDLYKYINYHKMYYKDGTSVPLETKFELLGYPRKRKIAKNLREELIQEIKEYLANGGSLHVNRKTLPFYEKLHSYSRSLQKEGRSLTNEEIMKNDFGFREFSDMYFRCKKLEQLKQFRDSEGYVDDYKHNDKFDAYVKDVGVTYNIPFYFVVTLLMDEKTRDFEIETDKIKYTHALLQKYAEENGTFIGIRRNNPMIYHAFDFLTRYYSDGSEQRFSKVEWLEIFGLDHVKNRFKKESVSKEIDISEIMDKLREEYQGKIINAKDLDSKTYHLIIKKAVALGVDVSEIFEMHGLKSKAKKMERLSRVRVREIPYYDEMVKRRNELINDNLKQISSPCKEELFEVKLLAVMQVYREYKERLETYYPGNVLLEDEIVKETTFA